MIITPKWAWLSKYNVRWSCSETLTHVVTVDQEEEDEGDISKTEHNHIVWKCKHTFCQLKSQNTHFLL